jgi:hypothetical protein
VRREHALKIRIVVCKQQAEDDSKRSKALEFKVGRRHFQDGRR